ncbi:protein CANDIDATE G-PROTEIN COUPLED RECEPTOR 7-like [Wolffia australiana]
MAGKIASGLFLFLLLSSIFSISVAEIKSERIIADSRPVILFEKFGFTARGHINIVLSNVSYASSSASPDPSLFGFFIISDESFLQVAYEYQDRANACILSSNYIKILLKFTDLAGNPPSFNKTFPITHPDEYNLFFASCARGASVSMSVRTEMYNGAPGGPRDYLSVGQSSLPTIFSLFAIAYGGFFGLWIYLCFFKNKPFTHQIHLLMAGLLLIKALYLVCAAENHHKIKTTGSSHGWDVLFYIFQFLRGILLFTVIVLVGTGWSFLKPFLQEREKKVLMIVIPLQVIANVASVVIGESGPFDQGWVTWNQLFFIVDVVCCCAVMLPIVWSIRTLKETSKTDGKAARNLAKLTLFRQFYIVVVGYLYFTRIVVFALVAISSYKYRWVSVAAEEVVTLAFYAFIFYMFRPAERNEYFAIDDDEEAAQVALQREDFEL